MKYGALSVSTGTLDLSSTTDNDAVILTWLERGGPAVVAPESTDGFGSKLVRCSLAGQLGGTIDYDWSDGGLIATMTMRRDRPSR